MTPQRVYTILENLHPSHTRNHRLVRAACAKGLTNVTITWYSLKEYIRGDHYRQGWYLTCDQSETWHIGYDVAESEARINKIEAIKN